MLTPDQTVDSRHNLVQTIGLGVKGHTFLGGGAAPSEIHGCLLQGSRPPPTMNSEPECEELTEEAVIVEALTRARRENRPCEFVLPATLTRPMRQRWAWPDGTVSEPDLERWNSLKYLRGLASKRNGVAPGAA